MTEGSAVSRGPSGSWMRRSVTWLQCSKVHEFIPDLHARIGEEHAGMPSKLRLLLDEEHLLQRNMGLIDRI